MLDCNRVVTAASEKDNQRLCELPHLFTLHSSWAHTSSPSKGFFLELLLHLYLSIFLRAGFCTMKAMIKTFFLIVSNLTLLKLASLQRLTEDTD